MRYSFPRTVIFGGTTLGDGSRVEEHALVGRSELGYAVGHIYPGEGASTVIGCGAVVRAGAVVDAGTEVGDDTVIGHHALLRSFVRVGEGTQLGHHLTVERECVLGSRVRCSPGSHITSSCVLADRVFLGAGVRTVNDRELIWGDPDRIPELVPPRFERGARVGSGSVILGGVAIGEEALIGAGSVVTRDIPAGAVACAAAVHDLVADGLRARRTAGAIADLRDNALIALGRAYAQINTALLGTLTAQRLSDADDQLAGVWGCSIKAHAADVANAITSDLAPLAGAAEFTATSRLVKTERDLRALLYADGIHDSLFRAAGRALTGADSLRTTQPGGRSRATPPPRSPWRPGTRRSGGLPAA